MLTALWSLLQPVQKKKKRKRKEERKEKRKEERKEKQKEKKNGKKRKEKNEKRRKEISFLAKSPPLHHCCIHCISERGLDAVGRFSGRDLRP